MTKISVIIVTYNNAETIADCLESLIKQNIASAMEIIVIDNYSTDGTVDLLKRENIKIIKNKVNLGFAKAVNQGAIQASGQYLFLLNPDVILAKEALSELIKVINSNEKIAMVGGKFINEKGKLLVSFGNFPSVKTEFVQKLKLYKIFPWGRYIESTFTSNKLFKTIHQVDWASGGFCLIKKDVFQTLGGFDENFFLYLEDVDLAKRIHELGYQIYFCPMAEAVHRQSRSNSGLAKKYEQESLKYYFMKHKK